ncbi:MAG: hypothetical protein REI94_10080 [Moraxellaceae bacterium]|nr:hypothetical protein [Moraxellaceae bacterium]
MGEPVSTTTTTALHALAPTGTVGIVIAGVATGLDYQLLLAGFFGAVLAVTDLSSVPTWLRAVQAVLSAAIAAYFAPSLGGVLIGLANAIPAVSLPTGAMHSPAAVLVGYGALWLLPKAREALGRGLDRIFGGKPS